MAIRIAFIITSVINTIVSDLTYGVRSYYNTYERFNQTLQTIHSIKQYVPTADIWLIEGSQINHQMEFVFESLVFKYKNIYAVQDIKRGVNSKLKGYGEAKQMEYILNIHDMSTYDYIFKISGRYYLTPLFNLQYLMSFSKIVFCKSMKKNSEYVSTVLYLIQNKNINDIRNVYKFISKIYEEYDRRIVKGDKVSLYYEHIIPKVLGEYYIIENIGVEGLVSSYGNKYSC